MSIENWDHFKKTFYRFNQVGFSIDLSCISFSADYFNKFESKFKSARTKMLELENGSIANPDENRMVGHYWLRNPEIAPNSEIKNLITHSLDQILGFSKKIHSGEIKSGANEKFTDILLVGIGGSALGPQLLADCFSSNQSLKIHFFDNTDPDGFDKVFSEIGGNLKNTLVLVISKSGSTPETRNGMLVVEDKFRSTDLDFAKNAVAITGVGSKLDKYAVDNSWLCRFEMWDWVGGRTSLFSSVGLVPAALLGIDVLQFIDGAKLMDELTRSDNWAENPAALISAAWHCETNGKGEKDLVILPYKDRLLLTSRYLQQLIMESIGKEKDLDGNLVNQGIAVYGNKGSTDQHAYVQQLREGVNNFFVNFIEVQRDFSSLSNNSVDLEVEEDITTGDYLFGFFAGTRKALFENKRSSYTITLDSLNAFSFGALIALYERAVGYYAFLVNINAYHQPGVEAGKKAASNVLDIHTKILSKLNSEGQTVSSLAKSIGMESDKVTIFKLLERLAINGRVKKLDNESLENIEYSL